MTINHNTYLKNYGYSGINHNPTSMKLSIICGGGSPNVISRLWRTWI